MRLPDAGNAARVRPPDAGNADGVKDEGQGDQADLTVVAAPR